MNFEQISGEVHGELTIQNHGRISEGPPAVRIDKDIRQSVSLSAPSGDIYFTTDGSQPSALSTLYSGSISVSADEQINAIAIVSGVSSPVASAFYAIDYNAVAVRTSNLLLWLRGDLGPVPSTGSITKWGDVSLNENDVGASSPNQPTAQPDAINNIAAVQFAPAVNGQFLAVPSAVSDFSSGFSLFIIAKPTSLTSGNELLSLGAGGLANSIEFSENASFQPTLSIYDGSGTPTVVSSGAAFDTSQFHLYEAVQSGTTATLYMDGAKTAQNTSMNSLPSSSQTSSFIGQLTSGGNYFSGQIAEVVLYNTALTQSERSALESLLLQKYQLTAQPKVPIISVGSSTLSRPTQVVLSAPSYEEIRFTRDGTTPDQTSELYTRPLDVFYSQTIKAIAFNGAQASSISSASYVLDSDLYPAPSSGGVSLKINLYKPSTAIP